MPRDVHLIETCVRQKTLYRGNAVDFCVDRVLLPNGKGATREYLGHCGAVAALPLLDRNTVVMVRQYRYPVRAVTYEIPAGKLSRGESPVSCMRRELAEETGYRARRLRPLVSYWPTPAFSNELLHIFVAEGLSPGPVSPDEDEFLDVEPVPLRRALEWISSGRIRDSKTMIALLAFERRRKR